MSDVGRAITAAMRLQRERDLRRMAWDLRLLGRVDVDLSLRFRAWCMWGWYLDGGGMGTSGYYADRGSLYAPRRSVGLALPGNRQTRANSVDDR